MVDAPVGRTSQHAIDGKLLIMAGGEEADVEAMVPLLSCMGDTIVYCGPSGSGSRMKLLNNYMSIASNVVTAEALTLAERSGLDRDLAIKVMMGTTAGQGHLATTYPPRCLKEMSHLGSWLTSPIRTLVWHLSSPRKCKFLCRWAHPPARPTPTPKFRAAVVMTGRRFWKRCDS